MRSTTRIGTAVLLLSIALTGLSAAQQVPAKRVVDAGAVLDPVAEKHVKLASEVLRAVESYEARGGAWHSAFQNGGLMMDGDSILVEVRCDSKDATKMIESFVKRGMKVRHHNVPGLIEAWVPVDLVRELEADGAVFFIRPAILARSLIGATDTEELTPSLADQWHAAGLDGSGVTIGNIDGGYAGFASRQATNDWPSGAQLTTVDLSGLGFGAGSQADPNDAHGTSTMEINYDMAPGAQFVAYHVLTLGDWYQALTQAHGDGVDIASVSLGAPLNGVGDGTECPPNFPPPCGTIAEGAGIAKAAGVLVVNAAGNERDSHWGGLYVNAGGFHNFGGTITLQSSVCVPAGAGLQATLYWDDWTSVNHDYDLILMRLQVVGGNPAFVQYASSSNPQTGMVGFQTPEEIIQVAASGTSPGCPAGFSNYGYRIRRINAPTNRNLQLFAGLPLFNPVPARSLGFPADSPNVFSVAAVDVFTTAQEVYSSEGPVLGPGGTLAASAILKPDLAQVANVHTQAGIVGHMLNPNGFPELFNGTSSATPHAAGLAALVLQSNPGLDVNQLADELRSIASDTDLGASGFDFQYGYGLLRFTTVPGPVVLSGLTFYDAAMTNPVNNLSVEVFNLDRGLSFLAATVNNSYSLDLDEGTEVSAGETLRLIAKDDTQFINVTDHVVTQNEIDTQTIQLDLVLDEFYLDVVDFPYYEADGPNFNENAGAAVAQMVLNYIHWDQSMTPSPPLMFADQAALYSEGIGYNESLIPYIDSQGMQTLIQVHRPGTYYNFSVVNDVDSAEILKQISKWIAYNVPGAVIQNHPGHVPGAIPAYGNYTNWMTVRGIHTSENACCPLPPNLSVFGFWINDPYPAALGGIGENSYKTANELLATYYFPLATGDSYDGKYVAILEPPDPEFNKHLTLIASPERFDPQAKALIQAARNSESPSNELLDEVNKRVVSAAIQGASEQLLPYDDGFRERFEQSQAGTPLYVEREGGGGYFAVPFNRKGTVAVVLIDADKGTFKEASWVTDPVTYPPLSQEKAAYIAADAMVKAGIQAQRVGEAKASLVHSLNPYFPDWRFTIDGWAFYVGQDASVRVEEPRR